MGEERKVADTDETYFKGNPHTVASESGATALSEGAARMMPGDLLGRPFMAGGGRRGARRGLAVGLERGLRLELDATERRDGFGRW